MFKSQLWGFFLGIDACLSEIKGTTGAHFTNALEAGVVLDHVVIIFAVIVIIVLRLGLHFAGLYLV